MFSLRDLRFVLRSRDLDVLRAQRIIGSYLNYPQINEVGKSNHMETNELLLIIRASKSCTTSNRSTRMPISIHF